jgi:hypothetical protein
MKTDLWGKHFWFVFHVSATNYPENPSLDDRLAFRLFYNEFYRFLPCPMCSKHYKQNIEDFPVEPYLSNKKSLMQWVVGFHNKVNVMLKKPEIDHADAIAYYTPPNGGAFKDSSSLCKYEIKSSPKNERFLKILMILNICIIVAVILFMILLWLMKIKS